MPLTATLQRLILLTVAASTAACIGAQHPIREPAGPGPVAIVASAAIPGAITDIARHSWFAVRGEGEEQWERWEVFQFTIRPRQRPNGGWDYLHRRIHDPLDDVGAGYVQIHGVLRGAEASRFIACLRRESPDYEHRANYVVWPGPNSNTYVDVMMRRCEFPAELPTTAIGKDYRGIVGASVTRGGTGVQVDSPLVGLAMGLTEELELHLLSLTVGIDWWRPALKVPADDGRLGCPATVREP